MYAVCDECRRILHAHFGQYRRWHKLFLKYSVLRQDCVDFDSLVRDLKRTVMLDAFRLLTPGQATVKTITQPNLFSYRSDWVLWNEFLRMLEDNQQRMTLDAYLRMMVIVSILKERREKDVQKGWRTISGIEWESVYHNW